VKLQEVVKRGLRRPSALGMGEHERDDGDELTTHLEARFPYSNHIAKQAKCHVRVGLALMLEEHVVANVMAGELRAKEALFTDSPSGEITLPFGQILIDERARFEHERGPIGRIRNTLGQHRAKLVGSVLRLREHCLARAC